MTDEEAALGSKSNPILIKDEISEQSDSDEDTVIMGTPEFWGNVESLPALTGKEMAPLLPPGPRPSSVQSVGSASDSCSQWNNDRLKTGGADRCTEGLRSEDNCKDLMTESSSGQVDETELLDTKRGFKNEANLATCAEESNKLERKRKLEVDGDGIRQTRSSARLRKLRQM
ncbi:hypothetical protein N7523_010286 [Penicillium sp. IBT 18751x]|nr:hypothetical protein N7523_010286 [Penicillium sp. IBT 18751x]